MPTSCSPEPPPRGHPVADAAARRLPSRLGAYGALWITLVIGASFVTLMTLFAANIYESLAEKDNLAAVDRPLLAWVMTWRSPLADTAVTWFTNTGSVIGMSIIALAAIAVLTRIRRSWRPLLLIGAAGAGSVVMTIAGKDLIGRTRPPMADAVPPYETSPSFPSGHTLNATAIIMVIAYLWFLQLERRWTRALMVAGCVAYVVLIGGSRIYLGHHWFTDVAVAWALGLGWAALVVLAHHVFHTVRRVRREQGSAQT